MAAVTVHVLYFAILREARGVADETITTHAGTTLDLYRELAARHGFTLDHASMKVAINDEFSTWDSLLHTNDIVVFIPPVAGG